MADKPFPLSKSHFEALAEFRYQMRRFQRFSELAARDAGLTPQQYLLMLQVKGMPGRDFALVGELAERLQMQHHGAVALVTRCESQGLVEKRPDEQDRRQVQVHLTAQGERVLLRLAGLHRTELKSLHGVFTVPQIDPAS